MNILNIRDRIILGIKYIMRFALKIYWIFPVRKNSIFFMANMGKSYTCNPKYVYKSIISDGIFDEYQIIWCVDNVQYIEFPTNRNVVVVNKKTYFRYFYYLLTSRVVIYNCGGFSYAPIRKKQFLIETWHGGGTFKKVGITVEEKSISSKKGIQLAMKDVKLFIASSAVGMNEFIRKGMGYTGEILCSGMPRNDLLLNGTITRENVLEKLNINKNCKIVLYAPTFRGDEKKAVYLADKYEQIDPDIVKNVLSERFGGAWKFYTRGHQYAANIDMISADGDLSSYPDMQELLIATDVLITDYSSSIWDFSLTRKPCILYVPDLDDYEKQERGFLWSITTWPGIIVRANNEFEPQMKEYHEDDYKKMVDDYLLKSGSFENGSACKQLLKRIMQELN